MSISACMIVKDEEEVLKRCLDSIHDWVDEIIIVDTGSTDKTVEIAEGYDKVKMFYQKWEDNFSKPRNYSMEQAIGDWIFIVDADEEVIKIDGLAMANMLKDGIKSNTIVVNLLNVFGDEKVARSRASQMRFFRRSLGVRYKRTMHNIPVADDDTPIFRVGFRIIHHGYDIGPEKLAEKLERMARMAKALTEEDPDNPEVWFHYARAIKVKDGKFNMGGVDEMETAIQRGLDLGRKQNRLGSYHIQLLYLMSIVKYMKKDYAGSAKCAEDALMIKSDYLDAIFMAGIANTYGVDVAKGEGYLRRYLSEQEIYNFSEVVDMISMEHSNSRAEAYGALVDIEKHNDQVSRQVRDAQEVENVNR